jgi:hypothetical protein
VWLLSSLAWAPVLRKRCAWQSRLEVAIRVFASSASPSPAVLWVDCSRSRDRLSSAISGSSVLGSKSLDSNGMDAPTPNGNDVPKWKC